MAPVFTPISNNCKYALTELASVIKPNSSLPKYASNNGTEINLMPASKSLALKPQRKEVNIYRLLKNLVLNKVI